MGFDPFSWAIGFTLTRAAGRLLKKSEARAFADSLRDAVLTWSHGLPKELSDLHPEAIVKRLFEADSEALGPKRRQLQECFEQEIPPAEDVWSEAICERREEVRAELGNDAQRFFKAESAVVERHIRKLALLLHQVCVKHEPFFKVDTYRMLRELWERDRQREAALPRRARPADGLAVLNGVAALPEKFVARPEYLGPLREKLLAGKGKAIAVTARGKRRVGVQGMGGIGKTVLAAAVVREEDVRRAFPDGVFWLTFGREPKLVARQVQLARWLGDEKATFEDTQQGKARLEKLLRGSSCLIVLDDIWHAHDVQAFDVTGEQSRLLITTRFRDIVAAVGAQEQELDALEDDQALALLAQWAGTGVDKLPKEAPEVVKECAGLPLALAMIGAKIQRRPERWEDALARLRSADIDKIRQDFPDYPYPDLLRAIEVSIDGLDAIKDRYLDFAIFPEDTPIPEVVLETLWGSDGLDKCAVHDILDVLEDRSMLRRDEGGGIILHDLQFDYVRKQADNDSRARHGKWLAAYCARCPNGWHTGPNDGYFYQCLAYHLRAAGRQTELSELLFDYRWVRGKLEATDSNAMMADYDLIRGDPQARLVQGAIRLSSHALGVDASHLPSQLCGRLASQKGVRIKALLTGLVCGEKSAWLRPLGASLTPPGGPLLRTLRGHESSVTAVAVIGDGRYAVSASYDNTLKVWDLASGRMVHTLAGHENRVNTLAVTPDGRYVVSGSSDRTLRVWDLASGKVVRMLVSHRGGVCAVAMTYDSRCAVSASYEENALSVWELTTGKAIRALVGHKDFVHALVVTPDGRSTISASWDKTLRVWDLASGKVVHILHGHRDKVNAVAVTPDGRYVVSGADDNTLKLWELNTGRAVHTMVGHERRVNAVAVTVDGRYVVSASADKTMRLWELATGKALSTVLRDVDTVNALAVTNDGRYVVSARDETLRVWELAKAGDVPIMAHHEGWVTVVAVTPDGRYAVSGSTDHMLRVWGLASGNCVHTLAGHRKSVLAVAVTSNGRYVISGSHDRTVRVWELPSGEALHTLTGHENSVGAVTVTGDGRYAISASEDRTLKVWDLATGKALHTLAGHESSVNAVAVTPDGRYAVSGSSDNTLKVWDLSSGKALRTLRGHEAWVSTVAVTGDGRYVVSGSGDQTLKVWDLAAGKALRTLRGHESRVLAVAVTSDGRYAVSGSFDVTLKVWDLAAGKALHSLRGRVGGTRALAVTGDGRYAVSGSDDKTLNVWELVSGRLVASFYGESDITCCAVATDSRTIVAGDWSARVHLLRLENAK